MCLNHGARTLAAAATIAALAAPAAHAAAADNGGVGGNLPFAEHHIAQVSSPSSQPDWALIAIAGGGTVILACAGLGGSRHLARRRTPAQRAHRTV